MPPFSIKAVLAAWGFSKWITAEWESAWKSIDVIVPQNLVHVSLYDIDVVQISLT